MPLLVLDDYTRVGVNRSPGPHVSSIIHHICLTLGHYDETEEADKPAGLARMSVGSLFEYALIQNFLHDHHHLDIGELEKDGIFGTPDLVDNDSWAIEEIKCTWMSSNHDPDSTKFWRYWVQVKAYCSMLNTRTGRLRVLHLNGDYGDSGPVFRAWEQQFTREELAENWAMLKTQSETMDWGNK